MSAGARLVRALELALLHLQTDALRAQPRHLSGRAIGRRVRRRRCRRPALDRLRPGSLAHARLSESIGDLVDAWAERHRGVTWLLTIEEEIDGAGEEAALTVYRMVHEGLVNALRHAAAETVEVTLAFRDDDLVVSIRDDGAGLPKNFHMGFGLLGMSERVRRLGGKLSVVNGAESGTLMMVSGPDNPTTLNFLPDTHIVVVDADDIAGDYETLWTRLRSAFGEGVMPRTVNLITGPSRSADIEQTLILGAHGPRRLHVVVVSK